LIFNLKEVSMPGTNMKKRWLGLLAVLLVFLPLVTLQTYAQTGKKPITYDAYDSWKSIQGTKISHDGRWLVYSLVPGEGDPELVVLNLQTGQENRYSRGKEAIITADNQFVIYTIAAAKAEVDKAKKEKKKPEEQPKNGLGIINLKSGEEIKIDRVKSFKLPEDSGKYLAYLLEPPLLKKPTRKLLTKRKNLRLSQKKRKNRSKNWLRKKKKRNLKRKKSQGQN